jgi:hypothetical protein
VRRFGSNPGGDRPILTGLVAACDYCSDKVRTHWTAPTGTIPTPRHLVPPAFRTGSVQPASANWLQSLRGDVLGEFCQEVESIQHVKVFLEVLGVGRVKEDPPL